MISVKVSKTKWCQAISDWLTSHLETGKYGYNRETLEPDYEYFEYLFIDAVDATAFTLTFNITWHENWTILRQ